LNLSGNVYTWTLKQSTPASLITQGTLDYRANNFKAIGQGITFLLLVTTAFIGLFNPAVGVMMAGIGLTASSFFGIFDISVTAIMGVFIVGVIIAWRVGR
jgi:hypothetical protein